MSINTTKNKDSLVSAWCSVVDEKTPTNWALYGYEDQTNVLKVVDTGTGGLEELIDHLDSSYIMYAFCRVIDSKTCLPKCLLINWQGEGAPIVRKGTCANHIRDIERLLKGAHITIAARSEDDVEIDAIMNKLARATASSFKFTEPRAENDGQSGPVGTTYRRVIPEQEINAVERDKFWQKEEVEEKKRLEQEKIKQEQERKKIEAEVRKREEKENQLREEKTTEKENSIARQKLADQRAEDANNIRNQKASSQYQSSEVEEDSKSRSEELRRQRSKEAQQLIAQRTINARAIFEQNTAAGQMKSQLYLQKVKRDDVVSILAAQKIVEETKQREQQPVKIPEETLESPKAVNERPSTITVPVPATVNDNTKEESKITDTQPLNDTKTVTKQEVTEEELCNQLDGTYLYFDPNNEGLKARALYDYQAADDTEITFDPGDIITHIDTIDEGWWQGLGPDGTYGLFPANYVEVIEYNT